MVSLKNTLWWSAVFGIQIQHETIFLTFVSCLVLRGSNEQRKYQFALKILSRKSNDTGRVHGNHSSTQQHARTARVEMITLLFPGLIQNEQRSVFSGCGGGCRRHNGHGCAHTALNDIRESLPSWIMRNRLWTPQTIVLSDLSGEGRNGSCTASCWNRIGFRGW